MFNVKLKKYRKENNLTQKQLAEKLGVSRSNIAEMESGRVKGNIKILKKLADISGYSIGYWTGEENGFIKNTYEALDTLIDTLININEIKEDGKIPNSYREVVFNLLEKEIALKIERSKEN